MLRTTLYASRVPTAWLLSRLGRGREIWTDFFGDGELSTERALAAKKQLEGFVINANRLTRVAGYADTLPFIKTTRKTPRNRGIGIILLFAEK